MLTPEEEQKLLDCLESASFDVRKRILGERGFSQNITIGTILWLAEKLKEAHDQNVTDVDLIIELEQARTVLSDNLTEKEYEIKQLQLKIDQLEGRA